MDPNAKEPECKENGKSRTAAMSTERKSALLSVSSAEPGRRRFGRADWIRFAAAVLLLGGLAYIAIRYFPFFVSLKDEQVRMEWIAHLRSAGFAGFLTAAGVQVLQVVVAVIPGEPVEIVMGYLYGTWGGLGVCLLGIFAGTLVILLLVKMLGASFVKDVISEKKMGKLRFLHNAKGLDMVVFILFLIPGTPKDVLTYFVPLTPMKPARFLLIATFARIPSVVSSTLIGASLGQNRWGLGILIFALTAVMGIAGIGLNNWYTKRHQGRDQTHS